MNFYVYILYSPSLDRYYVGFTQNLSSRLARHNSGGSRATKPGIPWELKYSEVYETRSEAMVRERAIKAKKSRKYLDHLILGQS
ncbi:GIY-YIG nuclease family protein [Microscilla marina]|uniref:GIY-YIG nuclease family protein n=1 Tax=Microscilla marina TaxID=1027 RepID=UPI0002D322DD|nr:GIY-YIG nuclease family protein [Microscilla marina]